LIHLQPEEFLAIEEDLRRSATTALLEDNEMSADSDEGTTTEISPYIFVQESFPQAGPSSSHHFHAP
jgi:hypothetical protein